MPGPNKIPDDKAEEIMRSKESPEALAQEASVVKHDHQHPHAHQENKVPVNQLFPTQSGGSEIHGANDINWKALPVETLPTRGLFYPAGIEITIKSALNEEIRQWSTIDESDFISVDKCLNFVLERCVRITGPDGTRMSWRDIKEVDRFFIIFRISELTFPNGENKLMINMKCNSDACLTSGNPYMEKIRMSSAMLQVIDIDEKLMQFYDPEKRFFTVKSKQTGKEIEFTLPSVGVSSKIKSLINVKKQKDEPIDWAFFKVSPYIISDWRNLDDKAIEAHRVQSLSWTRDMLLHMGAIADEMEKSVRLSARMVCPICNETITRALFFRGDFSIKDILSIPIGLDDLV